MKIVVVKFGGTSVANEKSRACAMERVKEFLADGYAVVAVVSAMGRKGQYYATDTLLSLLQPNAEPLCRDLIMNCGETISACVFADALRDKGVEAEPMSAITAGIVTDGNAGSAEITDIHTENILSVLKAGKVAVITGFQGIGPDGRVNTLGRGGSDTSAAALAGYLRAEKCVIYTDVPGVARCDPRIVPEAEYLREINAKQMLLLAQNGAGVIHERAVRTAIAFETELYVRSTFSNDPGTCIAANIPPQQGFVGMAIQRGGEGRDRVCILAEPIEKLPQAVHGILDNGEAKAIEYESKLLCAELPELHTTCVVARLYALLAR